MLYVKKTRKLRGIWRVRKRLPALALERATSDHVPPAVVQAARRARGDVLVTARPWTPTVLNSLRLRSLVTLPQADE